MEPLTILYGVACGVFSWFAYEVRCLSTAVTELRVLLARDYVTKAECEKHRKELADA